MEPCKAGVMSAMMSGSESAGDVSCGSKADLTARKSDFRSTPSKAEIGGVTDSQAPELIAQGCEPLVRPEMSRRRATACVRSFDEAEGPAAGGLTE
jgi:hypothetical protein